MWGKKERKKLNDEKKNGGKKKERRSNPQGEQDEADEHYNIFPISYKCTMYNGFGPWREAMNFEKIYRELGTQLHTSS